MEKKLKYNPGGYSDITKIKKTKTKIKKFVIIRIDYSRENW